MFVIWWILMNMDAPDFVKRAIEKMLKDTVYHVIYVHYIFSREQKSTKGMLLAFCDKVLNVIDIQENWDIAESEIAIPYNDIRSIKDECAMPSSSLMEKNTGIILTININGIQENRHIVYYYPPPLIKLVKFFQNRNSIVFQHKFSIEHEEHLPPNKLDSHELMNYLISISKSYVKVAEYPYQLIFNRREKTIYVQVFPEQSIFDSNNNYFSFHQYCRETALNYIPYKKNYIMISQNPFAYTANKISDEKESKESESKIPNDKSVWEGFEMVFIEASDDLLDPVTRLSAIIVLRRKYIPPFANTYQDILICRSIKVKKDSKIRAAKNIVPLEVKSIEKVRAITNGIKPKTNITYRCFPVIKMMINSLIITDGLMKYALLEIAKDRENDLTYEKELSKIKQIEYAYRLLQVVITKDFNKYLYMTYPTETNQKKSNIIDCIEEMEALFIYHDPSETRHVLKWKQMLSYNIFSVIKLKELLYDVYGKRIEARMTEVDYLLNYLLYARREEDPFKVKANIFQTIKDIAYEENETRKFSYNSTVLCMLIEGEYLISNGTNVLWHVDIFFNLLQRASPDVIVSICTCIITYFNKKSISKEVALSYSEKIIPKLTALSTSSNMLIATKALSAIYSILNRFEKEVDIGIFNISKIEDIFCNLESNNEVVLYQTLTVVLIISRNSKYCINMSNPKSKASLKTLIKGILHIYTDNRIPSFNHLPSIYQMSMQVFYKLMRTRESSCCELLNVFIESSDKNSSDKFIEQIFYHSFQVLGSYDPDYKLLELVCKSLYYFSANFYHIKIGLENNDNNGKYNAFYTRISLLAIDHLGQIITKAFKCLCNDQKQIKELSKIGTTFTNISQKSEAKFYYRIFLAFKSFIYRKSKGKVYDIKLSKIPLSNDSNKAQNIKNGEDPKTESKKEAKPRIDFYSTTVAPHEKPSTSFNIQAPTVILMENKAKSPSRKGHSLTDADANEDDDELYFNTSTKVTERAYEFYETILLFGTKFTFCKLLSLRNEKKDALTSNSTKVSGVSEEEKYPNISVSLVSKEETKGQALLNKEDAKSNALMNKDITKSTVLMNKAETKSTVLVNKDVTKSTVFVNREETKSNASHKAALEKKMHKEFLQETKVLRKVYFKITKCVDDILRKLDKYKKTNSKELSLSELI